jgi:hypothetical protein
MLVRMRRSGTTSDSALRRIVAGTGVPEIVEVLAGLPGADFTSLMLHVARERVARATPSSVVRQYANDRFVGRAAASFVQVRATEDALLAALPERFELLALSPLAPFGAHAALATVDQKKVVSTVRGSEVAADPTNVLALEAARRRKAEPRSTRIVDLATMQRVVRAQYVEAPGYFAHFQLLGLVSAGRDGGSSSFEREVAAIHVGYHVDGLRAAGAESVRVELTDFGGRNAVVLDAVRRRFEGHAGVEVVDCPDRPAGRGYYAGFCFKTIATYGRRTYEIGDGGLVDWTQRLTGSRKERCMISGLGVERLALGRAEDARDA